MIAAATAPAIAYSQIRRRRWDRVPFPTSATSVT